MRFGGALLLSALAHGALAALLVFWADFAPGPTELAKLDLSSVDLSFADVEDDAAAARPASAAAEPAAPVPETRPPEPAPPPEPEILKELPPDPAAVRIPEPVEERPPMETPPKKEMPPKADEPPTEAESEERPRPPAEAAIASAESAPAPRQARVDAPPRTRQAIRPKYPPGAQERGEQGDVTLEFVVTAEGTVGEVRVVQSSGFRELDDAAVGAVKKARFVPAKRGRRAVESTARLKLTYRLR